MRSLLAALAGGAALLAFASEARAAITVTDLARSNNGAGAGTALAVSGITAPAGGALLVVMSTNTVAFGTFGCTDDAGQTYVLKGTYTNSNGKLAFLTKANNAAMSGKTITCTWSGSGAKVDLTVAQFNNVPTSAPEDKVVLGPSTGTGTSATAVPSGTLAQANEVLVGALSVSGPITGYSSGFSGGTDLATSGDGTNLETHVSYKLVSSTAGGSFQPSWTTSRTYVAAMITLKDVVPGGGVVARPSGLTLMGVGK